jgi:large subunit ribosomal protein L24
MPAHVKKGDTVMVLSGAHKGKVGEIKEVFPGSDGAQSLCTITGVNLRTKHVKPNRLNQQGGIVTREQPLPMCKVAPVVDGKPTRVRFEVKPDGSKVRVTVKGGKVLSVVRGPSDRDAGKAKAAVGKK